MSFLIHFFVFAFFCVGEMGGKDRVSIFFFWRVCSDEGSINCKPFTGYFRERTSYFGTTKQYHFSVSPQIKKVFRPVSVKELRLKFGFTDQIWITVK